MGVGEIHIFNGTNRETGLWEHPCYNCGSLTYLGKLIPTVSFLSADYMGISFQCHNPLCDPIYEEHEIDWDENGDPCEPFTYEELIDYGAYWDAEDTCYFTPQCPRE